ncbi:MAG: hypothetical protein M1288_03420 [Actinobacteria bacterium]|nr:hypothetical protein [Actinomycetota bacterium]
MTQQPEGLLHEIETIWLDGGYDSAVIRKHLAERSMADAVIAKNANGATSRPTSPWGFADRWRGRTPGFLTTVS